jgi:hypothetical protein
MRRQFALPEADEAALAARGLPWETLIEAGVRWLIVHDFPVPPGYTQDKVRVAIRIETGYPDAPLDMVYVSPPLVRQDGHGIGALAPQPLDGLIYQRWSRHRTPHNPWRPGEDDLAAHLQLIAYWFERELRKA